MCLKQWGTERSKVSNGRGVQAPWVLPWKLTKKLHYGSCNQNYSRALLVNKISLVFLQSIKVILTLFFMPTIFRHVIDEKKIRTLFSGCTIFPSWGVTVWGRCKPPPQRGPGRSPGSKRILATIY